MIFYISFTVYIIYNFTISFVLQKPLGLLSLLDEESTFPKATDISFANKLKQHLSGDPGFKGQQDSAFNICHYAGEVGGPQIHIWHFLHLWACLLNHQYLLWNLSICYKYLIIAHAVIPGYIWYSWVLGEEQRSTARRVNSITLFMQKWSSKRFCVCYDCWFSE